MHDPVFTREDFRKSAEIGAEAMKKFDIYSRLLGEWNAKINLVADSTLADIWRRHFMDSAQLFTLLPPTAKTLADLGSGAGFPGLVLAIMAAEARPELKISLIERDMRKAAFIRTVAAETGTKVDILNISTDQVAAQFDVLTARALADLSELLGLSQALRKPSTICLFLKGKNLDQELQQAQKQWDMDVRQMRSCTGGDGAILHLSQISRKG
jgi:16S rRNA (guanine527-N7)-methyltransferase